MVETYVQNISLPVVRASGTSQPIDRYLVNFQFKISFVTPNHLCVFHKLISS